MAESANVVCAENISLLYLLNQIPSPPTVNTPPLPINLPDRYTLPFAAERSLASTLAFLSSITDSPRCITAICVQEQRGGDSLEIYVAINKRNPKDNNATLDTICGQFNQIFERLSGPGRGNCENDVFANIISLCKSRILCRLGYEKRTAFKSTRKPLDVVLEQARQSLVQLRAGAEVPKMENYRKRSSSMKAQISQFLEKSAALLKILSSWVQHRTDMELRAVVDGLCGFVATDQWRAVIDLIPDRLMDANLRQSLVSMLQKGARYRHAARILYRTAKKCPCARLMRAVAVHLSESAFRRLPPSASPASLQTTLNRVVPNHKREGGGGADRICQVLKTTPATFAAQTRRTLAEGKFHAEVQLLGHILTRPTPNPPRIVCASKDACFLCNCLLQQAHAAKLYTPRCHGKLYPGWRLPPTAEFRPLQASLNRILEQKIQQSAATVLRSAGRRRMVYPDPPCESTCSTAMLSVTTVAAAAAAAAAAGDGAADAAGGGDMLVERNSDTTAVENLMISSDRSSPCENKELMARSSKNLVVGGISIPPETSSQLVNMVSVVRNPTTSSAAKGIPIPPDTSSSSSSSSSSSMPSSRRVEEDAQHAPASKSTWSLENDWTLRQCYALAQGEVVAASLPSEKTSRMYTADLLRVQLEYARTEHRQTLSSPEQAPHLKYRIQQLTSREAHTARESGYIPIIDTSSLNVAEERTYKLDEPADLYLSAGDCMFRLVLQPAAQTS